MRTQPENFPLFLVGKDSRGNWVAQKQNGSCGGLFVSHAAALKFARIQNGNRPEGIITVAGVLELDMGECTLTLHRSDRTGAPRLASGHVTHNPAFRAMSKPAIAQAA